MQNEIIWVDDERLWVEPYVDVLRTTGFTVHYYDSVDMADRCYDQLIEVNGCVLDVMMPCGDLFSEEATQSGEITGLLLLRKWKDRLIARRQPVGILTNRSVLEVQDFVAGLGFPPGFVKIWHKKADTSKQKFPEKLRSLLQSNKVWRQ